MSGEINPEAWHNYPYPTGETPVGGCQKDRQDNQSEMIPWNALAESIADYEQGVTPDQVARLTLRTAYELARRLGGFRATFNLETTAHMTGGSLLLPVQKGWTVAQVIEPSEVHVEGDLISFQKIMQPYQPRSRQVMYHGYVPRLGEFVPPGVLENPTGIHYTSESICITALLKPRLTEQCKDGMPVEIYENYHDVLLYGALAMVFGTSGHVDNRQQNKFRAEYGIALRQIRVENSKRKNNHGIRLATGGFL